MKLCSECTGICCSIVAGEAPPGSWVESHFTQCKVSTLKRHGATLDIVTDIKIPCPHQGKDGKCKTYSTRKALCRSYYCHGKLFQRKPSANKDL
jgi:hypothetical protein